MYVTLVPAYGLDYKSAKEVREAWESGKDFQIQCIMHPDDGRYININDARQHSKGEKFSIRYKRLQQVTNVTY